MQTDLAPIVLFVYNRHWHARQTLEALSKNVLADKSKLFIYADGPKENATEEQLQKIQEVRNLIREKKWCGEVEIIEREKNLGLADSVITGVTEIVNRFGKIIVLEDDIVTSAGFLKYMNEALVVYENTRNVFCISGYSFLIFKFFNKKTFFLRTGATWGWATWTKGWSVFSFDANKLMETIRSNDMIRDFNFNNRYDYFSMLCQQRDAKIDSWGICWYASLFVKNGITLYPAISFVQNIGFDGTGTHYNFQNQGDPKLKVKSLNKAISFSDNFFLKKIQENKWARRFLELYFIKQRYQHLIGV